MKETINRQIGGIPDDTDEKFKPDFQLDVVKPPCSNPFRVEDDEMAQKLIISAVGAVLSSTPAAHRANEHHLRHVSEKVHTHLSGFYHHLERHHKVVAGLFLTNNLARLHSKLTEITKKEHKKISRIDSELAENKKNYRSNVIKLSVAGVGLAAIAIAATAPLLPTVGLTALIFG